METYKDIILSYNDEEWRLNRLKSLIDFLDEDPQKKYPDITQTLDKIDEIEDDKGILNIYYGIRLTTYEKLYIKHIWQEENEHIVKFIKYIEKVESPTFCPHCSQPPQKEDEEIKEYLNYLNYNNNI
jgi:transposase-like protein